MSGVPGRARLDSTLALALDGYEFVARRCRRHGADLYQTRLLLQRTVCLQGAAAARLFYDAQSLVERVRQGGLRPAEDSALPVIALHREAGQLLPPRVAAVELLNVVRPTVAIDRFVVFAALALHDHPEWADQLRFAGDSAGTADAELFIQEVRRFYPFFPLVAARVRREFDWRSGHFPRGRRVLLDLYGTNHDPRLWDKPEEFRPERFQEWDGDPFGFIPQGGGDHYANHRCAGEWLTIEVMKVSLAALTRWMSYEVPAQDLRISLRAIPAIPRSRFVIRHVRGTGRSSVPPEPAALRRRPQ